MAYHNVIFPTPSHGSSGGPGHSTNFLNSTGGGQTRLARWDGARRQYDAKTGVKTPEQAADILRHYLAREGGLHGFPFKDWMDFTTGPYGINASAFDDEIIGTGDGSATQFQLVKRYTDAGGTRIRTITKPVSGTVKSGVAGVLKTPGTHFTVDETTGVITYATAPTLGQQVTAGCDFDVPCHYGPGADALLSITIETFYVRGCPSIPIVEDMEPAVADDEFNYGRSFEASFSIPYQITPLMGRVAMLTPGAATDVLLLSASLFPTGGPYQFLVNLSGTHTITVKSLGATIGTLAAGESKTLIIGLASAANTWRLV